MSTPDQPAPVAPALSETLATFRSPATHDQPPPESPVPASAVAVPGYEILGELGRGGMGVVYQARQLKADRLVALKMILAAGHAGSDDLKRFRTEAEALARLQHPHIVGVYEVGEHDGLPFFSLEFCPGGSLERRLNGVPLPPAEAAHLVEKLARAMAAAHDKGVIHRDLKPANVLLAEDGTPKITDFGLAKKIDQESGQTRSGAIMGTPSYMAPEQAAGKSKELGPACDIYALGAVLYECLTGRPPFRAATAMDTLLQVVTDEPISLIRLQPQCPRDLETICLKCLQKDPARRYPTAMALAEDCVAFLEGRAIQARAVGRVERLAKWVKRRPATAALIAVSLIAVLALFVGGLLYQFRLNEALHLAEAEKQRAVGNLYHALLGEARGLRLSRTDGYRELSWQRLERALNLDTPERSPLALRCEAAACLGDPIGRVPVAWAEQLGRLSAVAIHPSGDQLAVGCLDGSVRVCSRTATGEPLPPTSTSRVAGLGFVQQGRLLVGVHANGRVRVWEAKDATWSLVRQFSTSGEFAALGPGHKGDVLALRTEAGVELWDPGTGQRVGLLPATEGEKAGVAALSPDGRRLALSCSLALQGDHFVRIWDLTTGKLQTTLRPERGGIYSVAFSPNGKLLASGCGLGMVAQDVDKGERRLYVGGEGASLVAFHPDGDAVALFHNQVGLVRLWSLLTHRELAACPHPAGSRPLQYRRATLAFTPHAELVLGSEQQVQLRDLSGGAEKLVVTDRDSAIPDIAFHPGGTEMASACKDGTVTLWNPHSGARLRTMPLLASQAFRVAYSPDAQLLAASDWIGTVRVWDRASGAVVMDHRDGEREFYGQLAFSPDGRFLAGTSKGKLQLWKRNAAGTGRPLLEPVGRPFEAGGQGLSFSPDGRWLAWRSSRKINVWDLHKEAFRPVTAPLPESRGTTQTLAFLQDSRQLMLALEGGVEVWDLDTDRQTFAVDFAAFEQRTGIPLGRAQAPAVVPSPDGTLLAVTGERITIWDVRTNELVVALPPEPAMIQGLSWSPDGKLLATGSTSGKLVVWRLETVRARLAGIGLGW